MAVPANVKYYEYLKSKKLDVPPTYDSFQKTLSDKEKAMKYYSYLSSKKSQGMDVDIPASFDSFYNTLNPKGASSEVGAASGEDLNAPQQPSAPSFTGAKGMKPRGIQPALKQEAEKPRPTKPYQDIMPKMEEDPSETTQAAVPAPISFAEQEQEKANESIRRGYLPSNPAMVNDRVISEVEKVREEEGMEPIEDVLSRRVALNQIDDVMETFGLSSEQVDDYMENSARDIDSMALDQITQAAGMDSEFLEYKKSLKTGDAISPIYQGRMRESQKKVFDAAMGDYWNFLARSNYGAYKDNKDKYDALKAKTAEERTTEDERWLKLTEDRATALYSAAAKKEAIGLKDNISQKLKSVAGVDYGKYLSATKDFNAKASALEKEHAAGKINDQQYEEKYNAAYDELEAIKRDSGVNDSTMATLNEIDDLTSKYGRTLLKDVAVKTSGFSETRSYDKWLEELEEKKRNSEDYERLWKESGAFGKAVLGGYEFTRKLGGSVFNSAMDVAGGLVRVLDAADAKGLYQGVGYDFSDQMYDKIMNMKAVTESKRFDADADSVLYNLADMTGNGFGSVVAFGLGGSAALALKAPAAAGTFVTGYLMAESSTYQELMDSGVVSSQEATLISNAVAPVVASIELLVPDSKVIQGYVRPAIRAAVVQGKPLLKAVDESLQTYAKSFGKEAFEEGLGYVGEVSAKNIVDAVGGYDYFNQEFSLKDLVINSLGGGLTGGLMNFFSYSSTPSPVKERAVLEMAENGQQIIDSHKNERTISDLRTTLSKPMEDLRGLKAHPNWNNLDRSKQARVFSISQQIRSLEESSVQDPIVKAQVGRLKAEQQEILSLGANGMDAKAVGVSTDKQRVFIGDQQAFFYINEDGDYEIEYNDGRSVVVSKGEGAAEKVRAMGIRADDGEVAAMNKENQNTLITPRLERGATVDYNGKNATVNSYKEKDGKVVYVNITTEDGRTLQIREGQAGVGQELLNNLNNLPYDQKDQTRISGEVGKGQEPVTTQPVESTSEEAPATGGVLQAQEEIDSVRQRINAIEAARREGRILEDEKPNELKGLKAREKELLSQETKPSGQKLTVGSKIQWDVFGNESMNEWTVAEETTTKGGQPAVRLTRFIEQGVAEGGGVAGYTQEHIVPIADLQGKPAAEAAPQTQGQEEVIAPQATEEAAPKTEEKPTRKTRLAKLFEVSEGEEAVPAIEQALSETGIKVEVMDDAEYNEDNRIKDSQGRGSEGMFVADDGTIILNRDKIKGEWGKTIVFHEGIHPVINIIRNTDPKRYRAIVDGLKAEATRNNAVAKTAADVAASEEYQRRGPESIEDETVVETMARVATGDVNIDKFEPTFREKFIEFMNDIAKALGLRPILTNSPRVEVKRLAEQINKMLNEGGKISDVVGKKNVGKFQNTISDGQYSIDARIADKGVQVPRSEKLPLKIVASKEESVMRRINELLDKYPNALTDKEQWKELMSRVFPITVDGEVFIPAFPEGLSRMAGSVQETLKEINKVSDEQRKLASEGLKGTKEIGELYKQGKMDEVDTGLYFLWNIMSIGISPYPQESGFLQAVNGGVDKYIKLAAAGKFNENTLKEYLNWVDGVLPKGTPGAGSKSNLNSFGKSFLSKAAQEIESGEFEGKTKLQALHEILSDRKTPTNELRRKWQANMSAMQFNNKIFDFILLTTGRSDLFVTDRVRVDHFWDGNNFKKKRGLKESTSLYDGSDLAYGAATGAGFSKILSDVPGLVFNELANRTMTPIVEKAYKQIGVKDYPEVGRFHWETWVAASSQEVSHGSIDAIVQRKEKGEIQDAGIRQGKYGAWDFNFAYKKRAGKDFVYEFVDNDGNTYVFDKISDIQDEIEKQKKKTYETNNRFLLPDAKGNISRPTKGLSTAWYDTELVDAEKYFEFLRSKAKEIIPAPDVVEDQGVVIEKPKSEKISKETKPTGQPSKGIKRGSNLVKDTYYEAGLTEDKNDYVFFHVSSAPKASIMKGIDSTKYTSLRTAREEKGLQYGVASYYTRPEDGERMVGGEKYAVRVPKGKVYPIDSDPMGYGEKAEENVPQGTPFRGEAVKREIADMAKKDGYQMIVGEWSYSRTGKPAGEIPEFRADALVPLKPTAEKPTSFTSNAEKGMERIPFPSQQSEQAKQELENIASEVRDIMSSKKKFSSKEYQLADSVYMSGQVTENKYEDNEFKRDITPEEYDMMTKVLPKNMQEDAARVRGLLFGGKKKGQASKGIPRTSKEFAGNVGETIDRIKAATSEDGATLNLDGTTYEDGGLVVPAGSLNVAQDEVTAEGLFDFLKDNEENISSDIFKIGLYKFPDRPEVSYDLNIVIPREYRDVALKFGELSGQESLFDLDTLENIKTGSDGKNPRKFTAQELAEIAKDLSEGRLPKIVGGKGQPSMMKRTPAQIRQAVEDGVDAVEAAIAEGMDPQQAIDENISNQDWYGDLSAAQKEQLNEILQDEFGASVREKNAVNDKARAVSDLWAEGSRESKKRITDILEDEPELSYIYANYPKILKQLESAGLITKTDGCP